MLLLLPLLLPLAAATCDRQSRYKERKETDTKNAARAAHNATRAANQCMATSSSTLKWAGLLELQPYLPKVGRSAHRRVSQQVHGHLAL